MRGGLKLREQAGKKAAPTVHPHLAQCQSRNFGDSSQHRQKTQSGRHWPDPIGLRQSLTTAEGSCTTTKPIAEQAGKQQNEHSWLGHC